MFKKIILYIGTGMLFLSFSYVFSVEKKPILYTNPSTCRPCLELETWLNQNVPDWKSHVQIFKQSPVGLIPYLVDQNNRPVAPPGSLSNYEEFIKQYVQNKQGQKPPLNIVHPSPQQRLRVHLIYSQRVADNPEFKEIRDRLIESHSQEKFDGYLNILEKNCRRNKDGSYLCLVYGSDGKLKKITVTPTNLSTNFWIFVDGEPLESEEELKKVLGHESESSRPLLSSPSELKSKPKLNLTPSLLLQQRAQEEVKKMSMGSSSVIVKEAFLNRETGDRILLIEALICTINLQTGQEVCEPKEIRITIPKDVPSEDFGKFLKDKLQEVGVKIKDPSSRPPVTPPRPSTVPSGNYQPNPLDAPKPSQSFR